MGIYDLEDVSLALQKNASDFIEKGLSYIIKEDTEDYKYALLHIFSGTLLFLKDILYKEHWSLIFQDVDKAKKPALMENEIISVNFSTLLFRLENLTDIQFEDQLTKDLKWMQRERNRIEHFYNSLNHFEVQSRIASLLGNLITLIKEIQKTDESYDLTGLNEHDYDSLFEMLQNYSLKFEQYISKRNTSIRCQLKQCDLVIKCPSCRQKALEIDATKLRTNCHFCLEELTYDMFLARYSPISYDYDAHDIIDTIGQCPNCNSDLLFDDGENIACLDCLETYGIGDISNCLRCGIFISSEGLCEECIDFVMRQ